MLPDSGRGGEDGGVRLHVVDGTFELYRAHFSPRPGHRDRDGQDVKATVGLAGQIVTLLGEREEAVTHVAIAFDNPIRSFRNDLFDGYKSDEGVPPELRRQFDLAEEVCRALGVTVWSMGRYEADDALATAAVRYADDVEQVRILSPDKDLGAVVRGDRVVLVDRIRRKVVDEPALRAARGIAPASVPDWLALVGDTADGIPGLAGFGDKSAAALLARYGSIEAIPDDAGAWDVPVRGKDRLAETLRAGRVDVALYKRLATLVTDVPLAEGLGDLAWRGPDEARVAELASRLAHKSLVGRVAAVAARLH